MKFQFYLPEGLELADYEQFSRLAYQKFPQGGVAKGRKSLCTTGGLSVAMGLLILVLHLKSMAVGWALLSGAMMLMGGWFLYKYGFAFFRYAAAHTYKKASAQRSAVTVTLDETGVENATETSSYRCDYADVRHLYRVERLYVLLSEQGSAFLLPRRALVEGNADELEGFLCEKTGCAVEPVGK